MRNPARRRVLFFAALAFAAGLLHAADAPRPAPKYLEAKPDQAEGVQILQNFRHLGIQGAYWLKFDLRVMPLKGDERILRGEMFGTRGSGGPLARLSVDDPSNQGGNHEQHFIFQNGPEPTAWIYNSGQHGLLPRRLQDYDLLSSIGSTDLTLFDLQMPFLYWTDFIYEGLANVRGRPAHVFLLYPPAPLSAPVGSSAPAAIRVYLDTQFSAMTQAEWLDAAGKPLKTVTVLDLKKIGEQWIVKSVDLRNHASRAKTRFSVTAAAFDLALPADTFDPEKLHTRGPAVPAAGIRRL